MGAHEVRSVRHEKVTWLPGLGIVGGILGVSCRILEFLWDSAGGAGSGFCLLTANVNVFVENLIVGFSRLGIQYVSVFTVYLSLDLSRSLDLSTTTTTTTTMTTVLALGREPSVDTWAVFTRLRQASTCAPHFLFVVISRTCMYIYSISLAVLVGGGKSRSYRPFFGLGA
jgi:hypothetical protein